MTVPRALELTQAAEADIGDILDHTAGRYGQSGRARYEILIASALTELRRRPTGPLSRERPE